jgi:peptide/nickel transport system permease protein
MSKVLEPVKPEYKKLVSEKQKAHKSRGFWSSSFRIFFKHKLNIAALVIFSFITIICFSADFIARLAIPKVIEANGNDISIVKPYEMIDFELVGLAASDPNFKLPAPPGTLGHILGTDDLGRDIFVRLLYGGQISLTIAFLVAFIACVIGTMLGMLAGYFGKWVDDLINGLVQYVSTIPIIFFLILVSSLFQPDVVSISLTIGFLLWVSLSKQVRGQVLSIRRRDYVEAARAVGSTNNRILFRHILPNITSIILVVIGFDIAVGILAEAALSFLGFGVRVPLPSWGNMLSDSQTRFTTAPWMVYVPALAIFLTVLCVTLIADGLRDAFDPRLRGR